MSLKIAQKHIKKAHRLSKPKWYHGCCIPFVPNDQLVLKHLKSALSIYQFSTDVLKFDNEKIPLNHKIIHEYLKLLNDTIEVGRKVKDMYFVAHSLQQYAQIQFNYKHRLIIHDGSMDNYMRKNELKILAEEIQEILKRSAMIFISEDHMIKAGECYQSLMHVFYLVDIPAVAHFYLNILLEMFKENKISDIDIPITLTINFDFIDQTLRIIEIAIHKEISNQLQGIFLSSKMHTFTNLEKRIFEYIVILCLLNQYKKAEIFFHDYKMYVLTPLIDRVINDLLRKHNINKIENHDILKLINSKLLMLIKTRLTPIPSSFSYDFK